MERDNSIADYFMTSVDENDAQERRYERAIQAECTPDFVDKDKRTAIFPGREGDEYETSLEECSCPDYKKREDGLPCKHMYRLAMELGIVSETFDFGLNINRQEGKILGGYDLLSLEAKELFSQLSDFYQRERCTFFIIQRSAVTRELALCGLVAEYTDKFYPVFSKAHEGVLITSLINNGFCQFRGAAEDEMQTIQELLLKLERERYEEIHEKFVGLVLTNQGQFYWPYQNFGKAYEDVSLV